MIDFSVKGLVKAYEADKNILDGLSFEIEQGEKVGILGKNGSGKTTLFRILAGELSYDSGDVATPAGKTVGLLSQLPRYPEGYTGEDVLKAAHGRLYKLQSELEVLAERMAEDGGSKETAGRYDEALARFEFLGGYDMDRNRNKVASGLGISAGVRKQDFSTLSGGERTRVNLARLILEDTDILLLDEPTNHLDMVSIGWLEAYIAGYKGTVLTISHDRYFLDAAVTRTIELVSGRAVFYSGSYSYYVEEKARRYAEQLKKYEREQGERRRLGAAADRLHQWGMGNQKLIKRAKAIRSRVAQMEHTERPDRERHMRARFGEKAFLGDALLTIGSLSKSYGGRLLFQDVDLAVSGGERIAFIGNNGTGKSSFIKLLTGEEAPDTGFVRMGPSVKAAYLPQIVKFQNPGRSALDTMIYEADCLPQAARDRLGAFKFRGEDVFTPVSQLSGGEQSRLKLCALMGEDINLLILDEPTNHLDLYSREWIEEVLEDYGEALLFVSHDRYFISKFATRIWELEDGVLRDFHGTFEAYRQHKERTAQLAAIEKRTQDKRRRPRKRGEDVPQKQVEKLEQEISRLEERTAELEAHIESHGSDYEKLMTLIAEKEELARLLAGKYAEWEVLSEELLQ